MAPMKLSLCLLTLLSLLTDFVLFSHSARADTFYRESFNYCSSPTNRPSANATAGWKAVLTNKPEGKPTVLKIQIKGAASQLPAVNSNPEGPEDGAGYWNRASKGLLIYSEETSFDIST